MSKLKQMLEDIGEKKAITEKKKSENSGSHLCCVPGCTNVGTVALGITRAGPTTSWKCSFHAWNVPCQSGLDWRDALLNERMLNPRGNHE